MSEPMVEVTRGALVECRHRGDIAVMAGRRLAWRLGDPGKVTYFRSAAKPIQALAVVADGAAERFGFSDAEIAVMCASHYGEPFHRETVRGILRKIGRTERDLRCGVTPSLDPAVALRTAAAGGALDETVSDCSGKHAGILAACVHAGWDPADYNAPDHPAQRRIRALVAEVCGVPEESIVVGVDGCSVPVFGLPLSAMARAYARLADPSDLPLPLAAAARRIFGAMTAHPEMIAGTGGFCTALIRAGGGNLIGKLGAEGVYCIGVREPNLALALKVADGGTRAIPPAALRALAEAGRSLAESGDAAAAALPRLAAGPLRDWADREVRNDVGMRVGRVWAGFHLVPA